jgi:hypothetical protein
MSNKDVAGEYFRQAGILDKQKSRVKRRMFESRKAVRKFKTPKPKDSKSTASDVQPIWSPGYLSLLGLWEAGESIFTIFSFEDTEVSTRSDK